MLNKPIFAATLLSSLVLTGCQTIQQQASSPRTPDSHTEQTSQLATQPEEVIQQAPLIEADTDTQHQTAQAETAEPAMPIDIWQLTRDNFKLDLNQSNPRLRAQLKWYARHPEYMNRVVNRASRYYHHILNEVLKRDMPAELALLPVVESAFDPFAYSHSSAAGPWQFIPGTGKRFGLRQNWWYDGRRDIVASTRAALDYLDMLQKRYNGDWQLALAAYNAGEGNVDRAVKRNRKAGKPIDFWSLKLPRETSAYVPKLLAVAKLFAEPEKYDFTPNKIANEPYFSLVKTGGQIDLSQAAVLADISMEELYLLNPGFNRWATDPRGPHHLAVPVAKAEAFAEKLKALPSNQRMSWDRYVVQRGDTISQIAKKFRTSSNAIKSSNKLKSHRIRVGQALMIPKARKGATEYVLSEAQRQLKSQQTIARTTNKRKTEYQVKSGDSFWSISQKHKVNMRSLASWNGMSPRDTLSIGQKLVIWKTPAASVKLATKQSSRDMIRKIGYRVRNGDSLYRIAGKFNVSIDDIKRWNKLEKKYLQPGQKLNLFVDIRN